MSIEQLLKKYSRIEEDEYDIFQSAQETRDMKEYDEDEYQAEADVYNRVSSSILQNIDMSNSKIARFVTTSYAIMLQLNEEKDVIQLLHNDEISTILRKSTKLNNIEFKNPLCFILGYWLSDNGREINNSKNKQIPRICKNKLLVEYNIKHEDIIRYARYWIIHH